MTALDDVAASADTICVTPAVEAAEVVKRFGGTQALRGISFTVAAGSITGVVGPNGSGKTTMLKCLSGFLRPTAGTVRVFGEDVTGASPQELWRRGMAQTFQRVALGDDMTVTENVLTALDGHRIARPSRLAADLVGADSGLHGVDVTSLVDVLGVTGLDSYADEVVGTLPLGIRRRTELARALAARPRILLLDEPASGLDARESADIVTAVRAAHDRVGLTILIVEHDLEVIAGLADHLVVLNFGQIIAAGGVAETLAHDEVRAAYLGGGHG